MDASAIGHAAEFRRCLLTLDIIGIRKLWSFIAPHLPQPKNDRDALHTLHVARTKAQSVPANLRRYSQDWLDNEAEKQKIACGVGISVKAPEHRRAQAIETRMAMEEAVLSSIKAGLDIDVEAGEVSLRMQKARQKLWG